MDNFRKLQEDIQAILEDKCCGVEYEDEEILQMLEEFDEYGEVLDMIDEMGEELTEASMLNRQMTVSSPTIYKDKRAEQAAAAVVAGAVLVKVGLVLAKAKRVFDSANKRCNKLSGSAKVKCMINAKMTYLGIKKSVMMKALPKCKSDDCKKSIQSKISAINDQMKEASSKQNVQEGIVGAAAEVFIVGAALKALRKAYDAKITGCDSKHGDEKSLCIFKAKTDMYNKKKALYQKALSSCTTNDCRKSVKKSIDKISNDIAALAKRYQ